MREFDLVRRWALARGTEMDLEKEKGMERAKATAKATEAEA